jgi:hypothetical protein
MRITRWKWLSGIAVAVLGMLLLGTRAEACPFCSAPSLTLGEQVTQSDAVVLVKWVEGRKGKPVPGQVTFGGDAESAGETETEVVSTGGSKDSDMAGTTYEVVEILRNAKKPLKAGDRITLSRYRAAKPGDLFLLMGTQGTVIEWSSPLEITKAGYKYIAEAPATEPAVPTSKRLEYYMNFLEHTDELVANDAYGEFAKAPYEDITPLAKVLPREKIRKWVANPDTPQTRMGLYGLLMGLCGTEEDAKLMEQKIGQKTDDFRLGIDGVMSGYLLLTGAEGLEMLDETKLKNKEVPFSETYAAMQALRFMWTYAEGVIDKDRLRQSMRVLLDRPELADLVIADLARWKDWSVQDQLMKLYGAEEYNIPSIKRAIVRYMLVSAKDAPESEGEPVKVPTHVAQAKKYLDVLREQDPRTVREAERFFFLN